MSDSISVILCTHQARSEYLRRCLEALRQQTLSSDRWDLLIVDNRTEPALKDRLDLSWHRAARIVREDELGLTKARLRGIRQSEGDLLVFVDDDNVLDPDFLEVALATAAARPFLGSWSGQCRPEFECEPPAWTRRYRGNLVIRQFESDTWSNLPRLGQTMPCGAGLCVRREVAREYLRLYETGRRAFTLDRVGGSLLSGGDNDLAACACDIGLGVGLIAKLKLTHLMAAERLTEPYLARLVEGIAFSSVVIAYARREHAELAAYEVRWTELARALLAQGPHRRIALAGLRGRRRGLAFVSTIR